MAKNTSQPDENLQGGSVAPEVHTFAQIAFRRFIRSKTALVGGLIVAILIVLAIFGPSIAPFDPVKRDFTVALQAPSSSHWLGTDEYGRDVFSRILHGSRIALMVGLFADSISLVLGVALGLISGYYGGRIDTVIMRFIDIMLAFPYLLLAMLVVAILGPGLYNAMLAIGIVYMPRFARIVRGSVLSVKERDYIEAARASGAGDWLILTRHVLVNCMAPIIVQTTLTIAWAIVETAGLGFLGLGAQPPYPEWGAMLSDARSYMLTAPWIATFPGIAIVITVIGFNLIGDGLRDALDPRLNR